MKKPKNNIPTFYAVWAILILVASALYTISYKYLYQNVPDWYVIFAEPIVMTIALVLTGIYMKVKDMHKEEIKE